MTETVGLQQLLLVLLNGGSGIVVYWLLGHPLKTWWDSIEAPDTRSWIAAGIAALIGLGAWGLLVALQFLTPPTGDWRSWVMAILNVLIGAFTGFSTRNLINTKAEKREYAAAKAERLRLHKIIMPRARHG